MSVVSCREELLVMSPDVSSPLWGETEPVASSGSSVSKAHPIQSPPLWWGPTLSNRLIGSSLFASFCRFRN